MASKVIAVPKSTIINGPPYFSYPATPLTILSAPTSLDCRTYIHACFYGPTTIGSKPNIFYT